MFVCLCGGGLFIYYVNSCIFLLIFFKKLFIAQKNDVKLFPRVFPLISTFQKWNRITGKGSKVMGVVQHHAYLSLNSDKTVKFEN